MHVGDIRLVYSLLFEFHEFPISVNANELVQFVYYSFSVHPNYKLAVSIKNKNNQLEGRAKK